MQETDLAYIAGIVDGEGCIRIKRTKPYRHLTGRQNAAYHAVVQIRMVDEDAIRFIAESLGGWYYVEKPHSAKGRPLFCYSVSNAAAERVLRTLRPYLRVKAEQADVVLALRALQAEGHKHRTKVTGTRRFPNSHGAVRMVGSRAYSDECIAECERLYALCSDLKRR